MTFTDAELEVLRTHGLAVYLRCVVLASGAGEAIMAAIGKGLMRLASKSLGQHPDVAAYVGLGLLACLHVATVALAVHFARRGHTTAQLWTWLFFGVWVVVIDVPVLLAWLN